MTFDLNRWQAADPLSGFTAMVSLTMDQRAYRFRHDDGDEAGATWMEAENTPIGEPVGEVFRLRIEFQETAGGSSNNVNHDLQYSINGGAWVDITESSVGVRLVSSLHVANQTSTTDQLTGGTGDFREGSVVSEVSTVRTSYSGNDHTEYEWVIEIVEGDVGVGDTIEFRGILDGLVTDTTTVTPSLEVIPPPPPSAAPTLSSPQKTYSSITLNWTAVSEADGYVLQRDGVTVYSGPNLSFQDTGLEPITEYTYTAWAYNEGGDGPVSDPLVVETHNTLDEVFPDSLPLAFAAHDAAALATRTVTPETLGLDAQAQDDTHVTVDVHAEVLALSFEAHDARVAITVRPGSMGLGFDSHDAQAREITRVRFHWVGLQVPFHEEQAPPVEVFPEPVGTVFEAHQAGTSTANFVSPAVLSVHAAAHDATTQVGSVTVQADTATTQAQAHDADVHAASSAEAEHATFQAAAHDAEVIAGPVVRSAAAVGMAIFVDDVDIESIGLVAPRRINFSIAAHGASRTTQIIRQPEALDLSFQAHDAAVGSEVLLSPATVGLEVQAQGAAGEPGGVQDVPDALSASLEVHEAQRLATSSSDAQGATGAFQVYDATRVRGEVVSTPEALEVVSEAHQAGTAAEHFVSPPVVSFHIAAHDATTQVGAVEVSAPGVEIVAQGWSASTHVEREVEGVEVDLQSAARDAQGVAGPTIAEAEYATFQTVAHAAAVVVGGATVAPTAVVVSLAAQDADVTGQVSTLAGSAQVQAQAHDAQVAAETWVAVEPLEITTTVLPGTVVSAITTRRIFLSFDALDGTSYAQTTAQASHATLQARAHDGAASSPGVTSPSRVDVSLRAHDANVAVGGVTAVAQTASIAVTAQVPTVTAGARAPAVEVVVEAHDATLNSEIVAEGIGLLAQAQDGISRPETTAESVAAALSFQAHDATTSTTQVIVAPTAEVAVEAHDVRSFGAVNPVSVEVQAQAHDASVGVVARPEPIVLAVDLHEPTVGGQSTAQADSAHMDLEFHEPTISQYVQGVEALLAVDVVDPIPVGMAITLDSLSVEAEVHEPEVFGSLIITAEGVGLIFEGYTASTIASPSAPTATIVFEALDALPHSFAPRIPRRYATIHAGQDPDDRIRHTTPAPQPAATARDDRPRHVTPGPQPPARPRDDRQRHWTPRP